MNDDTFLPEVSPDDAIVSAHLDGEASAEDAARLESDSTLRARQAAFAEVRDWVGTPVTVPAHARDAAIGAALRVFDDGLAVDPSTGNDGSSPPTDLGRARARRDGRPRGPMLVAIAAAVVVVLVGLGAAIKTTQRTATDTAAVSVAGSPQPKSQTYSASTEAGAGVVTANGPESTTAESNGGASPTTTASPPVTSVAVPNPVAGGQDNAKTAELNYAGTLGALNTPAEVRAAVNVALGRQTGAGAVTTVPAAAPTFETANLIQSCDAAVRLDDSEIGPLIVSGSATYQGTNAVVLAFVIDLEQHPAANGPARIYTVDAASCRVLDVQTI
jgi:cytoskeletal protein RodZ